MSAPPTVWTLSIPLGLMGVCLAVLVRWGRVRGGGRACPPACRRCGYDVSHRPPGVDRCSECGADLTRPHAVRTTVPRIRPAVALPAVAVLVVGLPYLFSTALTFPWRPWVAAEVPLGWVIGWAKRDHSPAGDVYRTAWAARGGATPPAAYYDHLLDLQADPAVPRTSKSESDLEMACGKSRLTPTQSDRCARQLFAPLTFAVRSPVRPVDDLTVEAAAPAGRGSAGRFYEQTTFAIQLDGQPVLDPRRFWQFGIMPQLPRPAPGYRRTFFPREWCPRGASPGRHKLGLIVSRELLSGSSASNVPLAAPVVDTATLDLDVLPATAPLATAAPDPALAEQVARAVDLHVYHWPNGRVFAVVNLLPAAVDRGFRVDAVIDGTDQRLALLAAKAGGGGMAMARVPVGDAAGPQLRTLTLVLTGDPDAAAGTIGQTRYWPGRIRYADVPVQTWADYQRDAGNLPRPTTRPFRIQPGG